MIPLPSPATSSSSSGELPLCIGSDTSSLTTTVGPISSTQELLLQGKQLPQSFQTVPQPPQPPHSSSWADEVAAKQSDRSKPETVVPNWAYSRRILGPHPRSRPLFYPPPVMSTPVSQPTKIQHFIYGVPQFLHLDLNRPSLGLLDTICQLRPTTTPARTLHHKDVTCALRMKYTPPFAPQREYPQSTWHDFQISPIHESSGH